MRRTLITLTVLAALLATALPAYAMLSGEGTLTVDRDGNTINAVEVSGLEVPRGMAQAASAFVLNSGGDGNVVLVHSEAVFTGGADGAVTVTAVELLTDAVVKNGNGGTVALTGCIDIPAEDAAKLKAALDGGATLTLTVTTHLVLVDAAGGEHTLGARTIRIVPPIAPEATLSETIAP